MIHLPGIKLTANDLTRLKNSSKVAQALENKWDRRVVEAIQKSISENIDRIVDSKSIKAPDFEELFIEHYFDVQIQAMKLAEKEKELEKKAPRLASRPKTLQEIMKAYDLWKKGKYKPKSIVKKADRIKKEYISSIKKTWEKYSEDFRNGDEATQEAVKDKIIESTAATEARAQTIVRTETTRYYNDARVAYYNKSDDVTHYLFMAVRDKATTKWCTPSTVEGKRGRHGLVYAKEDPLTKKEQAPCHWNCRSEFLPLNKYNPSHKRMIEDESLQRRNHSCHPLPPGWNK